MPPTAPPIIRFCKTNNPDWQKIGLSYGLTRVVAVGAASDTTLRINAVNTASGDAFDLLRFDMIGGADFLSAQRHSPDASCSSEADPAGGGEILVVTPNFNGAIARVSLVKPAAGASLRTANNGCTFYLESTSDNFDATLRVTYSAGEAVLAADYPLSNYDGLNDRSALIDPLILDSEPTEQTIVVVPVDATANYSPLTLTAFAASIFTSRESTLFEGAGNDLATIFYARGGGFAFRRQQSDLHSVFLRRRSPHAHGLVYGGFPLRSARHRWRTHNFRLGRSVERTNRAGGNRCARHDLAFARRAFALRTRRILDDGRQSFPRRFRKRSSRTRRQFG